MSNALWDWVDKLSQIEGIISLVSIVVAAALTGWAVYWRRRHLKEVIRKPGNRPAVLIITAGADAPIDAQVLNWLGQQEWYNHLDTPPKVYKVTRLKRLSEGDMEALVADLRRERKKIMGAGHDKIHLFWFSPLAFAAKIGAELKHGPPVVLYQHNRETHQYEDWGVL